MENSITCPVCHTEVKPTDYFCFNCGKNLKPKPRSTSVMQQIVVYLESILLPPYGIVIGIRYLQQKDTKSKAVGIAAMVLTIISLIFFTVITLNLMNTLNTQLTTQFQGF